MLDMQKERLRHLMASAVLDLWRKETGSMTSVLIEGTVCITCQNGRSTIVQVCDRFPGSIPEDDEFLQAEDLMHTPTRNGASRLSFGESPIGSRPFLQTPLSSIYSSCSGVTTVQQPSSKHPVNYRKQNGGKSTPYERKSVSTPSKRIELVCQRQLLGKDDNNNVSMGTMADKMTSSGVKMENSDDEGSALNDSMSSCASGLENGNKSQMATEGSEDSCDKDDSGVQDLYMDLSVGNQGKATGSPSEKFAQNNGLGGLERRQSADLLLSSPQSYTEQMRDAIRQRLVCSGPRPILLSGGMPSVSSQYSPANGSSPFGKSHVGIMPSWAAALNNAAHPLYMGGHNSGRPSPLELMASSPFSPPRLPFLPPGLQLSMPPNAHNKAFVSPMRPGVLPGIPTSQPTRGVPSSPTSRSDRSPSVKSDVDCKSDTPNKDESSEGGECQRIYKCEFCAKTFLFKSKYHEHLPVHTSARPFQCHLCSRTYKYKYDLRVHLRTHLGIPTKSTVCPFCTDKFGTNKLLRQHIREAHSEQHLIGEEQCTKSLEALREAVRRASIEAAIAAGDLGDRRGDASIDSTDGDKASKDQAENKSVCDDGSVCDLSVTGLALGKQSEDELIEVCDVKSSSAPSDADSGFLEGQGREAGSKPGLLGADKMDAEDCEGENALVIAEDDGEVSSSKQMVTSCD